MNENYIGCFDNQTTLQKDKNYKFTEVCTTAAPVVWLEKSPNQWKRLQTIRDQANSGTCVTQTYATEMSILFFEKYGVWVDFTAAFPYQKRNNPTIPGCSSVDVYSIFPKIGNIFEYFMPSQKLSEAEIMLVKMEKYFDDLAKTFNPRRIWLPIDFETIASTIQATGKGIMVWFHFHPDEWTDIPTLGTKEPISGHSVIAIDSFLVNSKKYILIVDSWGTNYAIKGYRLISEEYFNARCFLSAYLMNFKIQDNSIIPERPHFTLNSVSKAKDCLKWEGLFPANVPSNDVADNIFRTALIKYQTRYIIKPALGNFGPLTNAHLLKIYP